MVSLSIRGFKGFFVKLWEIKFLILSILKGGCGLNEGFLFYLWGFFKDRVETF